MAQPDVDTGWSGRKKREQWFACDICGFLYPISELTIQTGEKGGAVVCVRLCFDEPARGDYTQATELPKEAPLSFVEDEGF